MPEAGRTYDRLAAGEQGERKQGGNEEKDKKEPAKATPASPSPDLFAKRPDGGSTTAGAATSKSGDKSADDDDSEENSNTKKGFFGRMFGRLTRPMLKALEILGFKSFADRTRFEFPPGITVVVGPNGSGKSNIVDAIKWVLGEQSVKSLRGHEMADVIFNGSGSRRALNAAEITLTFDNSKHLLAVDTPEVHITRRVYRSGEGEYLINRNPARLRDIRDLLSGTGMGTQAYSVIEQGKVDVLLQSSPRDRRVIFEEAAGISRFKIRKIEALRRLERVEQNLLRLSDIVDEVESRLRSVRTQAAKARRYKEHTDRLQELRTASRPGRLEAAHPAADGLRGRTAIARPAARRRGVGSGSDLPPSCSTSTTAPTKSPRKSASRRPKSPPIASGSPPPRRPSSTSGTAAPIWSRKSPATAANWRP